MPRHVARRDEPAVTRRRYAEVSEPKAKDPSSEGTKALWLAVGGAILGTSCCAPVGLALIVWSLVLVFSLRQHYIESGVGMPTKLVLTIIVNAAGILGTLISMLMMALYMASA